MNSLQFNLFGITAAAAIVSSAHAQAPNAPEIGISLEVQAQEDQGATLHVTLTPPENYHSYYINAGVGGFPPTLEWTLPEGWSVGDTRFPLPHQFDSFGATSFGYDSAHTLILPLSRNEDSQSTGTITVQVDLLICDDESCVPVLGTANLNVTEFPVGNAQLPHPTPISVSWGENQLALELNDSLDGNYRLEAFYPATKELVPPDTEIPATANEDQHHVIKAEFIDDTPRPIEAWIVIQDLDNPDSEPQPHYVRTIDAVE